MLCILCTTLPQNMRTSRRHEHLQQIGITERISRPGKAKAAWITRHVCEICETEWRHVDDPVDPYAGWSIERIVETCE
jgi:hypothetical protein